MVYRKGIDSETWHWDENCPNWPTNNFSERDNEPMDGKLCEQCETKEK